MATAYSFEQPSHLRVHDRIRTMERARKRDNLAKAMSHHGDVARAADEIGVSRSYGRLLFAEIKRGLGWQAQ
jgi:hypothetical protein